MPALAGDLDTGVAGLNRFATVLAAFWPDSDTWTPAHLSSMVPPPWPLPLLEGDDSLQPGPALFPLWRPRLQGGTSSSSTDVHKAI